MYIPGNRYMLHIKGPTKYVQAQSGRLCDKPHYEAFSRLT
jgi:hypothetical protein